MDSKKNVNPYVEELRGTVLETTTILSGLLRPHQYSRDVISDLAIGTFLEKERTNIYQSTDMHLLSLKKSLLYAIPVISKEGSGIALTAQVSSPALRYDSKKGKITNCGLAVGDKFKLVGLSFPKNLINHLRIDVFPWKHFRVYPENYDPMPINISHLKGVKEIKNLRSPIYLIDKSHFEDTTLFNEVNRLIAIRLADEMSNVLATKAMIEPKSFKQLASLQPFNSTKFIDKLNTILPRQIDKTYTMAFYEALQMTTNWLLYDQIHLLGYDSPEVISKLAELKYIKEQNIKVRTNLRLENQQLLEATRAEKIAREKYPYYFDFTDRRCMFVRFNVFAIAKKEQQEVRILLQKELAAQQALLKNKCEHIPVHARVNEFSDSFVDSFKQMEKYIDYDSLDDDKMYSCKLCKYQLVCQHTLSLYEAILSSNDKGDNSDDAYKARQQIVNKYKTINQQRTGEEETESLFTFYCKHCSAEIGKSTDVIQAGKKTIETSLLNETDPMENMVYSSISNALAMNMNQSLVPVSKGVMTKLIFDECKDEVISYTRIGDKNQDNIETLIKYLAHVYTIAALISINANKLKVAEGILVNPAKSSKSNDTRAVEAVEGGNQVKNDLLIAFNIIQSNNSYKRIGITNDKIKTMLIRAFKFMNNMFSNESVQLKTTNPQDRLRMDIISSPISKYAAYIKSRGSKSKTEDILESTGIDLTQLFPKGKKATRPDTHALYTNIYKPKKQEPGDIGKYINESYKSLVDLVTQEPIEGKFLSMITDPISKESRDYEYAQGKRLKLKRSVPMRFLPVENSREYDYTLRNNQIAYCLFENKLTRPHRWNAVKKDSKVLYTCRHCSLEITKASKNNNSKIEEALDEKMMLEAFFELYTISCPVKDSHTFESDKCTQCKVTKDQISSLDLKYYKQHESTYRKHRESITRGLIEDGQSIASYAKTDIAKTRPEEKVAKADLIKLESLASSLSKLYGKKNLDSLGIVEGSPRSLDVVNSYVRLFYSHYTFAKNISIHTSSHPDPEYYALIKDEFFDGVKPKKVNLPSLPTYPTSTNADQLLIDLFQIIYDIASKQSDANLLIGFILKKINDQNDRHKSFNFAKLKSIAVVEDNEDEETKISAVNDDDEDEYDMFDGYDISADDIEDNIDGDID